MKQEQANAETIGRFYDQHAGAFLKVYGDVIQAFRTTDVAVLLDHQARAMEMAPGMRLLDAGCGVCGPALYFAKNHGVFIDAVTASGTQARLAAEKIREAHFSGQVVVRQGDYHTLELYYPQGSYDTIYFLESFGHSQHMEEAISSAWNMLKPGGRLYIKDLFVKEAVLQKHENTIEANIQRINQAYCYAVIDLYEVLRRLRRKGFILSFLKTIDIPLEAFENLTLSNEFQELTGIHRIDDLVNYIFPVDFFELLCIRPWYHSEQGNNKYFLQNLYNLQIQGMSHDDL